MLPLGLWVTRTLLDYRKFLVFIPHRNLLVLLIKNALFLGKDNSWMKTVLLLIIGDASVYIYARSSCVALCFLLLYLCKIKSITVILSFSVVALFYAIRSVDLIYFDILICFIFSVCFCIDL